MDYTDQSYSGRDMIPPPAAEQETVEPPKATREHHDWERLIRRQRVGQERLEKERKSRELDEYRKQQQLIENMKARAMETTYQSPFPANYDPTELFSRNNSSDNDSSDSDDEPQEYPFENHDAEQPHQPSPGEEEWKNRTEYLEADSEMTDKTWTNQEMETKLEEERDKMQKQWEEALAKMERDRQPPVTRTMSQESSKSNDSTVTVKAYSKKKEPAMEWPIFIPGEPGKDIMDQTTRDLFNETTHVQTTLHTTRFPKSQEEQDRLCKDIDNRKPPPKPAKRMVEKRGHQSDYLLNDMGKLNLTKPDHHGKKVVLLDVPIPSNPMFAALTRDQLNMALYKQAQEELTRPEYRQRIHGADELHVTLKEVPREQWKNDQTEHYKAEAERILKATGGIPITLAHLIPPHQICTKRKAMGNTRVLEYDERPTPRDMLPPIIIAKARERANSCSYQTWADIMPPRGQEQPKEQVAQRAASKVTLSPAKLINLGTTAKIPGQQMSKEASEKLLELLAKPQTAPPIPARPPTNTTRPQPTHPQQMEIPAYKAPARPQSPPLPVRKTPSLGERMKCLVTKTSTHVDENTRSDAQFSQTLRDASVIPKL